MPATDEPATTIAPSFWFHRSAAEAAERYLAAIPGAVELARTNYPTEQLLPFQQSFAGEVLTIELDLAGLRVTLINAGDEFRPNASLSIMLNFDPSRDPDARASLDATWAALADGGEVLMPLQAYGFSERYGWLQDRWGVGWQLILTNPDGEPRPFAMPAFLFAAGAQGRAREAIDSWTALLPDSAPGMTAEYPVETGPARPGDLMFADFRLAGQWCVAMDSGVDMAESFTPGGSMQVSCADQQEIDRLWAELSTVPEAEQCGWCEDRFGASWQVVPADLAERIRDPEAYRRMLDMHKIVIADL